MKFSLICCPFFTDGDYPPLGLMSINGALRDAGHDTSCFDFAWLLSREAKGEFHLLRQFFAASGIKNEVVFAHAPELGLYLVYGKDFRGFNWRLNCDSELKPAAVALCLSLWNILPGWAEQVLAASPAAALFSCYSSNVFFSLALAKHLKTQQPDLPVIFGGPAAGLPGLQELLFATGLVDGLVVGEGELTVSELCADLEKNMKRGIAGLALPGNGKITFIPRPFAPDLDALPRPSVQGFPFPGFDYQAYKSKGPADSLLEGFPISSTRGCVNRCAYCSESAYWKKFRQRRPEKVIADLEYFHERCNVDGFAFGDSSLNGKPGWLKTFCWQSAALGFKPYFWSHLIPGPSLNERLAGILKAAGFCNVTLGVETFSSRIRARICKRMDGEDIFRSILALTRAGINVTANVLVGFPGETRAEYEKSNGYIKRWSELSRLERGPGRMHWEAGHRVRVEAYSSFYQRPEQFGVKIFPYEIPLPDRLAHLKKALAPILLKCSMGIDEKTIEQRSVRMQKIARAAEALETQACESNN